MTTTTETQRPRSFGVRLLIALFKFILFVVLTAGVFGLSIVVMGEIRRSQVRTDELESQIGLMRSDINSYVLEQRYNVRVPMLEQDVAQVASNIAAGTTAVTTADAALQAQLDQQATQLAVLEAQLAAAVAYTEMITENLAILNTGVSALQNDLTVSVNSVDDLAAELNGVNQSLTDLDAQNVTELALFRLWGLVVRTQLSLANDDAVAAQAQIKQAQTAAAALATVAPPALGETLATIQTQLDEAADLIATDPEEAAVLLDTIWDGVDAALETLLTAQE